MAKAAPKSKVEKLTRAQASNQVLASMGQKATLSELAAAVDQLLVDQGGESRPKSAAASMKRVLETAEALGQVELTRPTDIMVSRVK